MKSATILLILVLFTISLAETLTITIMQVWLTIVHLTTHSKVITHTPLTTPTMRATTPFTITHMTKAITITQATKEITLTTKETTPIMKATTPWQEIAPTRRISLWWRMQGNILNWFSKDLANAIKIQANFTLEHYKRLELVLLEAIPSCALLLKTTDNFRLLAAVISLVSLEVKRFQMFCTNLKVLQQIAILLPQFGNL